MICYKDRTFCSGDGCAKFEQCPRAATADVRAKAEKLGLPICEFTDPRELQCWTAKEEGADRE